MKSSSKSSGRSREMAIRLNKGAYWFNRHWLAVFNSFFGLYAGLAVLTPVLMKVGLTGPASALYYVYSFFCHGMATRSFFLFGEQIAYPTTLAGTTLRPIESYTATIPSLANQNPANWFQYQTAMSDFIGNELLGYKIPLCERDLAMYTGVLIAGLLFALLRRRVTIRPLPIIVFVVVGVFPIAWDGFSQMFGYLGTPLPGVEPGSLQTSLAATFPLRESTPLLRVLTGGWFGLFFGWLIFSNIDQDMRPLEGRFEEKLAKAGRL